MNFETTQNSRAVQNVDALTCGDVLIVDDDRAFGGFMVTALESRGHDVDWAGSVEDGLASLYARRYDLVIIDLRLSDGSGLHLLRQATDERLLAQSAAIILTGHDDEAPDDIRVFRKDVELDPFLDRVGDIVAATRRHRWMTATRVPASSRAIAFDKRRPAKVIKIELILYTRDGSETCRRALSTIHRVLEQYNKAQVSLTVCDLTETPEGGDDDSVIYTPTLVKRGPGPRTWIVGNLDQDEFLVDLLELNGVDRRRAGR
jgi:ActR/RegA family two-component response regulator